MRICSICAALILDERGVNDPEWGWIHKKCQDSIPSKND